MADFRTPAPALARNEMPGAAAVVQAHASMADRFAAMADRSLRQVEATAEREAAQAGAQAGEARPGVQMQDGGELYRSAYNRAALESGTRRLEISARDRLAQLAEEHKADPGAFSAQAQAYRDGVLNTLPETMRPTFTQAYDTLALPFARQARANADQAMQQQRIATFNENQTSALASIERYGLLAARDPAARAALALEMDNQLGAMVALGPKEAFTFGGRQYEADPTRAGAATLPQLVEMAQRVHDRAIGATAMGEYQAGPRTEGWVEAWEKRQLEGGTMLSDQVRRVAGQMRADAAHRRALAAEGRTEARAQLQPLLLANEVASRSDGKLPFDISDQQMRAAGFPPVAIAQMRARWTSQQAQYTAEQQMSAVRTPEEANALAQQFQPGSAAFLADPRGAAQAAAALRRYGATIGSAQAEESVRDLMAQAAETGTVPRQLGAEDAARWQLTAVQVDKVNADIALHAELGRIRRDASTMPPEAQARWRAEHPIAGEQADENRQRVQAFTQALSAWERDKAADPAAAVLARSPVLQRQAGILGNQPGGMGRMIQLLDQEQEARGIPQAQRTALPKAMLEQIGTGITEAPDPETAFQRLTALARDVGPAALPRVLQGVQLSGGAQDDRRQAMLVAGGMAGSNPAVARDILRGAFALRSNPVPAATPARMERAADEYLGNALAAQPGNRAMAVAAARALYANAQLAAGTSGANSFDDGAFHDAMARVLPMARWNGRNVPLPPSTTPERFRSLLENLAPQALAGAQAADGRAFTPDMLARGGSSLLAVGPGRYALNWGGMQVLAQGPDGQPVPFVLDLNGAEPRPVTAAAPRRRIGGVRPLPGNLPPIPPGEDQP